MPDSSQLESPRVFSPIHVHINELDQTVEAYSTALGVHPDARLPMPDVGVTVVSVGGVVVVATAETQDAEGMAFGMSVRAPGDPDLSKSRDTNGVARVILAADLDTIASRVTQAGMVIAMAPIAIPAGRLMYVVGPDGSVTEWLEYRPLPGEEPAVPV
jgi:predicted enzyme related to lactoylglutathione lyase